MIKPKDRYDEIFEIEVDGWCYGIQNFPGEIFPALIHGIIRELRPSFAIAIKNHYAFNILDVAAKISKAAKYLIHEKEVAFSMLSQLPNPAKLDEDEQYILAQIIDQVEQAYGGAIERMRRKWSYENKKEKEKEAA
ncbi:MAG: hypothetical protein D6719_11215 [Candidatus Dadabacteria bacterium]|nr:MAG: hypothetical protein D6719_11215 [Candidatus Dadabacteria bacterium]